MQLVARIMTVALLLPVAVVLAVRVLGLDLGFPWVAIVTVLPWLLVLAVVAGAMAAIARWTPGLVGAGLVLAIGAAVLVPRLVPGPNTDAGPDATVVTVGVANLRLGLADADALVAAVQQAGIEVLVTLELTEDAIARLEDAGLTDRLPNDVLEPSRFTSGGGIHSSLPLTALPSSEDRGFGRTPRAEVQLTVPGPVVVEAVHPLPPIQDDWTQRWRSALRGLPDPDGGGRRLLAGDFNATHDHAPFRAVLDRGWNDAADAVGRGLVPTFNALPWGEPVPPVTLDHVLVDGDTEVLDVRVLPLPGSDHRLLVVDIAVPAG